MIRNIDACELLLVAAPIDEQVARLAGEALFDGAAVAIGHWLSGGDTLAADLRRQGSPDAVLLFGREMSFTDARLRLRVRPDGFGGSDGFGSKPRECERSPLPARSVVLTNEIESCVEAMESGMRSVGILQAHWSPEQVRAMDRAADVLLDDLVGTYASDLSTPGAFWLNPPLPRMQDGTYLPDPDENMAPCRRVRGLTAAQTRSAGAEPASGESESKSEESSDEFLFVDDISELRF